MSFSRVDLKCTDENREQVHLAKMVLALVQSFQSAIIAGGAPRSWYLGKLANDVDIFLSGMPSKRLIESLEQVLVIGLGATEFEVLGDPEKYKESSVVYEFSLKGYTFQLIIGTPSIHDWKYDMSKIFLASPWEDSMNASKEFLTGFKENQFIGDKNDKYIQKFMGQFPDIRIITPEEAELFYHLDVVIDDEEELPKEQEVFGIPVRGEAVAQNPEAIQDARPQAVRQAVVQWEELRQQFLFEGNRVVHGHRHNQPQPEPEQPNRRRNPFEAFFGERR